MEPWTLDDIATAFLAMVVAVVVALGWLIGLHVTRDQQSRRRR